MNSLFRAAPRLTTCEQLLAWNCDSCSILYCGCASGRQTSPKRVRHPGASGKTKKGRAPRVPLSSFVPIFPVKPILLVRRWIASPRKGHQVRARLQPCRKELGNSGVLTPEVGMIRGREIYEMASIASITRCERLRGRAIQRHARLLDSSRATSLPPAIAKCSPDLRSQSPKPLLNSHSAFFPPAIP